MRRICIAVIRPHIDYCSQVWAESEGPFLDKIERLQSYFTRQVPEICDLSYTERLKAMNLSSIQRRFDRYKILYAEKVVRDEVPAMGIKLREKCNIKYPMRLYDYKVDLRT